MAQENKSGLVNKINQHLLCAQLNMRNQLTLKTLSLSNQELKIIRQYIQKKHNFNSVSTNKQLKFDSNFLNETKYSEFINHIWSLEHKRIASKFRIRQYNLKIETGRFATPKTPDYLTICDHCRHYKFSRKLNARIISQWPICDLRKTLFIKINNEMHLQITLKMMKSPLFSTINDSHIIKLTVNFVFKAIKRRKKHKTNELYDTIINI